MFNSIGLARRKFKLAILFGFFYSSNSIFKACSIEGCVLHVLMLHELTTSDGFDKYCDIQSAGLKCIHSVKTLETESGFMAYIVL